MQLLAALFFPLTLRLPFSCVQCIWVCGHVHLGFYLWHLFGPGAFSVSEPYLINLCELSTCTNPKFCFLLNATELFFSLALFCAG